MNNSHPLRKSQKQSNLKQPTTRTPLFTMSGGSGGIKLTPPSRPGTRDSDGKLMFISSGSIRGDRPVDLVYDMKPSKSK